MWYVSSSHAPLWQSLATHTQALRYAQRKLLKDLPHRVQSSVSHERCRNRWGSAGKLQRIVLLALGVRSPRGMAGQRGFPRLSRCLSIGRIFQSASGSSNCGPTINPARIRQPRYLLSLPGYACDLEGRDTNARRIKTEGNIFRRRTAAAGAPAGEASSPRYLIKY
jgi:hypothetical protein